MFEGDSADMCAGKIPLVTMGGWAEGLACADHGASTPIGASGFFFITFTFSKTNVSSLGSLTKSSNHFFILTVMEKVFKSYCLIQRMIFSFWLVVTFCVLGAIRLLFCLPTSKSYLFPPVGTIRFNNPPKSKSGACWSKLGKNWNDLPFFQDLPGSFSTLQDFV